MEDVLYYAGSSKQIEEVLRKTYLKRTFPYDKPGVKNKHFPLFNKTLYEQIIGLKRIPTVEEYEKRYISKYSTREENTEPILLHANRAYKSLLTDLHFYFVLKESRLFDKVAINYIHDTAAKTDILLEKAGRKMGLQLFSGSKNYERAKAASIKKLRVKLGYELYLFSLNSKQGERKSLITINDETVRLYSLKDAQFLADKIKGIHQIDEDQLVEEEEQDDFELLDEIEVLPPPATIHQAQVHSVIFGGGASAGVINNLRKQGVKVFHINVKVKGVTPFKIVNGSGYKKVAKYLADYGHTAEGFNLHQYIVEHANPAENIAINAGAGSGKTTTLVSRILYLLDTGAVQNLPEIGMITFTNEAANNMEAALTKNFLERYQQTGNQRYLHYLEDIQEMRIMTIPSFGKEILSQYGHHIGLGNALRVAELKIQRDRLIDQCLDEVIADLDLGNPFGNLKYFKAKSMILDLWERLEQKGVIGKELAQYKIEDEDRALMTVVIQTIIRAEERFNASKVDQDILTVSDLTRYLKKLTEYAVPLEKLQNQMKYLFVDEFQDTDIAQIKFIATIASRANLKLVIVGDLKQSIYRFRGSNSTAFSILNHYLTELGYPKTEGYGLYENFRSSQKLISDMEVYFSKWRRYGLLPSDDKPMYSRRKNKTVSDEVLVKVEEGISTNEILIRFRALPKGEQSVLAILVRTNNEARQIGTMLREMKNAPNFDVQMDGTLFMSKAARDLLILLQSWIFPTRRDAMFSLSTTAFALPKDKFTFKKTEIASNKYRIGGEDYAFDIPTFWKEARILLKYKPLLAILNEFISRVGYKDNLKKSEYKEMETLKYELNLQKVLMMIHNQFNNDAIDLMTLYDWLKVQVSTNRDVDEAEIDNAYFDGNFIKVMTVHKAKGLEFHTVLIPYTNSKFVKKEEYIKRDVIVQIDENNKLDFGWKYIDDESGFESETDNYSTLKQDEDDEQRREETRLLYVAMTRAEQLLYIYDLDKAKAYGSKPNTWGELLLM